MDEEMLKAIAGQLRQPSGEYAVQVGEKMNEGNLHINRNTIEALGLEAGDNILEIGMGNGFFVKDILAVDPTITYTGCDFSSTMVDEATKRNEDFTKNGRAQFFLASADKLPFGDETFDKVFTVNTVYFWEDQQSVLAEISRVLKPGGQITISVRPKSVMQHYPFVKYGFTMFSREDLSVLLTKNNFTVTNVLEREEPPQEVGGEMMKVETLVVNGKKE